MILLSCFSAFSQQLEKLNTSVFDWNKLQADKTEYGESRLIFKGRTNSLSYFEVHVSLLNPGEAVHTNQRHPDIEELIIVKDGNVEQRINGRKKVLGPGSVILITPGDKHGITNEGTVPASYYMLNWKVENPVDPDRSQTESDSQYYDWNEIEYEVPSPYISNKDTRILPSFDFGLYYYTDMFYAGAALTHLSRPSIAVDSANNKINGYLSRHFILTSGYAFMVNEFIIFLSE